MKIDRLMGILSVLLQKEKTTAPKLAEKFEVSVRTINRDIESLCASGIPIQTTQGCGGGIQIMEGYSMERTLLTSKDMQMILAGLHSLDSVSGSNYYGQLMEKLKSGSSNYISGRESILIDLSSWDKSAISPKIEVIQEAIESRSIISFDYYGPSGYSARKVEPYYLIFKWSSWYIWGWCMAKKDFRLFKLSRMDKLLQCEQTFQMRAVSMPNLSTKQVFPGTIHVKALFEKEMKWRLVEEFGIHSFTETDDGKLLLSCDYTDEGSLISWILSFGNKVILLEPANVKEDIKKMICEIEKNYLKEKGEKHELY